MLYSPKKKHNYPLNKWVGGPQGRSGYLEKRKIDCLCWNSKPESSSSTKKII